VLRETTIPVLLTPPQASGPVDVAEARSLVRRILVPIDLSPSSSPHLAIAERVAAALEVPVIVAHVIEPVKTRLAARLQLAGLQADRRGVFEDKLKELVAATWAPPVPEALLAYGDPAEELAKIARDRDVGLIVIGLHGSPQTGPRMGSVTYRLLCLIKTLVLAIPPKPA
jgi:nucleotide-binding universal stress UspA family protein